MFKSLSRPDGARRLQLPFLPSQCAVCRGWPARQVCDQCVSRFSPAVLRCPGCATELAADLSLGHGRLPGLCIDCTRQHPAPDVTLAAVSYVYPWSELVTRYKFGDRPGWAGFFAGLLLRADGVAGALEAMQPGDLVIAVPLSGERLQSRGFNQAWELAAALARQSRTSAKAEANLLLRVAHTRPQTELKREARLANVKGAFQVDPLRQGLLQGRRVILVDDVMTSGASLFSAAEVLRSAGAVHITAMVFARTPVL